MTPTTVVTPTKVVPVAVEWWSLDWMTQVELVVVVLAVGATMWAWIPPPARRPAPAAERAGGLPVGALGAEGQLWWSWWRRCTQWAAWARGRPDGIPVRLRTTLAIPACLGVAVVLQAVGLVWWVGWLGGGLVSVTGWIVLGQVESDAARRRRQWLITDLPYACDLLAACLETGLPLRRAAVVVAGVMPGPVAEDLMEVHGWIVAGEHEPLAWRRLARIPPWSRLVTDLARSVDSGTAVIDVLRHHARRTREAAYELREVRARTAGVRSVLPLMLCFLPAFFLIGVVPIVASLVTRLLQ